MSKFKVGDKVRNVGNLQYDKLSVGVITDIGHDGSVQTDFKSITGKWDGYYWISDKWMELIEPGPNKSKTYTLTPYIKPETVTIKGVEYIMTENA